MIELQGLMQDRSARTCRVALIILTAAALILTLAYHPDAMAIEAQADTINMFQY